MKRMIPAVACFFLVLCLSSCLRSSVDNGVTDALTDTTSIASTEATDIGSTEAMDVGSTEATDVGSTEATDIGSTEVTTAPSTEEVTTAPAETTEADTAIPETKDPVQMTYPVESPSGTFTGLPALPEVEYTVNDPDNTRGLSTERIPFSYGVAKDSAPHNITVNNQNTFDSFGTGGLAWDNKTEKKVLYLTFDCGYKYGDLTGRILDTLKEKDVKAAFFCTMSYLKVEPAEIARMINEGHIVGNHTVSHPDCTTVSREKLAEEILGVHNYMRVNFGYSPEYFRFPTGVFSENVLELVHSVGYKSAFWSVAYEDWDPEAQLGADTAFARVSSRLHPGAVILLHSTSPDNAAILGRLIDYARGEGYEFATLDDYGYWE